MPSVKFHNTLHESPRTETMLQSQVTQPGQNLTQQQTSIVERGVWGMLFNSADSSTLHLTGRTIVGRYPPSQFLITDERVSGKHFEIFVEEEVMRQTPRAFEQRRGDHIDFSSAPGLAELSPPLLAARGGAEGSSVGEGGNSFSPSSLACRNNNTQVVSTYWLLDHSTNGTFVNHVKIGKNRRVRIYSGDDISVVQLAVNSSSLAVAEDHRRKRGRDAAGAASSSSSSRGAPTYVASFVFHVFHTEGQSAQGSPCSTPSHAMTPNMSLPENHHLRNFLPSPHSAAATAANLFAAPDVLEEDKDIAWQWGGLIGAGAQSQVYKGINIKTGEMLAVKVLRDLTAELVESADVVVDCPLGNRNLGTTTTTAAAPPSSSSPAMVDPLEVEGDWTLINGKVVGGPPHPSSSSSSGGSTGDGHSTVTPSFLLDRRSGSTVLKRRDSSTTAKAQQWGVTEEQRAELRLLRSLKYRRIVQYLGFAVQDNQVCILLEYVAGGALSSLISNFGSFTESVVRVYALQILQGLEFLHKHHVVHGDIKPANILVSDRGLIKLSDFGTGKILRKGPTSSAVNNNPQSSNSRQPSYTSNNSNSSSNHHHDPQQQQQQQQEPLPPCGGELTGTPLWMSPELVRTQNPSFSSDIWAFGLVVLEMATGRPPWSENPYLNTIPSIVFHLGSTTVGPSLEGLKEMDDGVGASEQLTHFVQSALTLDPKDRPTASALLLHPFLTQGGQSMTTTAATAAGAKATVATTTAAAAVNRGNAAGGRTAAAAGFAEGASSGFHNNMLLQSDAPSSLLSDGESARGQAPSPSPVRLSGRQNSHAFQDATTAAAGGGLQHTTSGFGDHVAYLRVREQARETEQRSQQSQQQEDSNGRTRPPPATVARRSLFGGGGEGSGGGAADGAASSLPPGSSGLTAKMRIL